MLLPLAQAAEKIGVHPDTLKGWSLQDPPQGPRFTRTAGGHRRYDEADIQAWQQARSVPALPTLAAKAEAYERLVADGMIPAGVAR